MTDAPSGVHVPNYLMYERFRTWFVWSKAKLEI